MAGVFKNILFVPKGVVDVLQPVNRDRVKRVVVSGSSAGNGFHVVNVNIVSAYQLKPAMYAGYYPFAPLVHVVVVAIFQYATGFIELIWRKVEARLGSPGAQEINFILLLHFQLRTDDVVTLNQCFFALLLFHDLFN